MTTIKDWDDCIAHWYKKSKSLIGPLAEFSKMMNSLLVEYIPEPYYGDYKNCITPVININPGSGCNEDPKNWNYRNNPNATWIFCSVPPASCRSLCAGQLLYDLEHVYSCKYSAWQKYYSPLVAHPCVPGVDWWKNNRNEYINRIVELYCAAKIGTTVSRLPKAVKNANNTFSKDFTPFALELCPLHSKKAPNFNQKSFIPTYIDNTIAPACISLKYSKIPFGLGFGAKVYHALLDSRLFDECIRWENGYEIVGTSQNKISGWPLNYGKPINRTYSLLKGKCGEKVNFNNEEFEFKDEEIKFNKEEIKFSNDKCPYFLITWHQASFIKITHQCMLNFDAVDNYIVGQIAQII